MTSLTPPTNLRAGLSPLNAYSASAKEHSDVYPALNLSEQTTPTSPPNPPPLNAYTASLFAVTVPVSTNGHKTYHLLDGMHKLILI